MSENYRYYVAKMAQCRASRVSPALHRELNEILAVVRKCEAIWALEDRIEQARRGSSRLTGDPPAI